MSETKRKLDKVLKRIDGMRATERNLVFKEALKSQSRVVCAHVQALKASRKAGLEKLKQFSPRRKSTQPSRPCDNVTTVNQLIKCLESCCKKFEKSS
jgi:hypothetical protein